MRLTLRTLLAYLDDTLETSQVKKIGQKVAESDTAQELIARIKQVTRRRRITVPTDTGTDGKLDPNKIAEYLDNALSEDEVAEVEQICLGSDVHLAEMASCHQILTLVLGEPILIPPSSRQRMYGLVKGKEAIHFRKPPVEQEEEEEREELYEADETLRMGIPAFRKSSWTNRLMLIGGSLAACALLVLAIFQALNMPSLPTEDKTVKVSSKKNADDKQFNEKNAKVNDNSKQVQVPPKDNKKKTGGGGEPVTLPKKKVEESKKKDSTTKPKDDQKKPTPQPGSGGDGNRQRFPDIPIIPPDTEVVPAGQYKVTEQGLLMQRLPAKTEWQQVIAMQPVQTSATLVSLPGFKSEIKTNKDLRLILWGLQPEQVFFETPLLESAVVIHQNQKIDLDLTLLRGRITITNATDTPKHVRLRYHNPTNPKYAGNWDFLLKSKGTEILVERWSAPANEPFFENPKDPQRKGPIAFQHVLVIKGKVELKERDLVKNLQEPPGEAYVFWDSLRGTSPPVKVDEMPVWASGEGKLPKDMKDDERTKRIKIKTTMQRATDKLSGELASSQSPMLVLASFMKSESSYDHFLALRCYAALGNLEALIDALDDPEPKRADVRRGTIPLLKRWLSYERGNDYRFHDVLLKQKFADVEAHDMIWMLHGMSPQAVYQAGTYKGLAKYLNNPRIALREVAGWQLYLEIPNYFDENLRKEISKIQYDPSAPDNVRQQAREAWLALVEQGKLPPQPPQAPPNGKKQKSNE